MATEKNTILILSIIAIIFCSINVILLLLLFLLPFINHLHPSEYVSFLLSGFFLDPYPFLVVTMVFIASLSVILRKWSFAIWLFLTGGLFTLPLGILGVMASAICVYLQKKTVMREKTTFSFISTIIPMIIYSLFIVFSTKAFFQFLWFEAKGLYHGGIYLAFVGMGLFLFAIVGWLFIYQAIISNYPKQIRNRFIAGMVFLAPLLISFVGYLVGYTNQVIFENCRITVSHGTGYTYKESVPELINTVILGWITVAMLVVLIILTIHRIHQKEHKKVFLTTPLVLCSLNAVISLAISVFYTVISLNYFLGVYNAILPSFKLYSIITYPNIAIACTYKTLVPLFVPPAMLFASIPFIITKKWLFAAILLFFAGALTFPLGILGIIAGIVCLYYYREALREKKHVAKYKN